MGPKGLEGYRHRWDAACYLVVRVLLSGSIYPGNDPKWGHVMQDLSIPGRLSSIARYYLNLQRLLNAIHMFI